MATSQYHFDLFASVFNGRRDVVPKFWAKEDEAGNVVRSGYAPICANFWVHGVCPKESGLKQACDKCPAKSYVALSPDLLQGHFDGKHILGIYPLLPDGTCHFIAADFDDHSGTGNPLPDVRAYSDALKAAGLMPYVLRSKSGKGYHVNLFFTDAVPAWKARRVAFSLLQEAGLVGDDTQVNSFDRLFPNQDELGPAKPLGNLIGLPFQGQAAQLGHTLLLDPATGFADPFLDQLSVLASVQRASEADLDGVISSRGLTKEKPNQAIVQKPVVSQARTATVPAVIPQSARNDTLFRLACSLQSKGLSDSAIHQVLQAENAEKCSPPLDIAEVEVIASSVAARYAKGGTTSAGSTGQQAIAGDGTSAAGQAAAVTVHTMLPSAPVSAHAVVPGKALLSTQNGIEVMEKDSSGNMSPRCVFPAPVLVVERLQCIHTRKEQVKLAWHIDGEWRFETVDRKVIADFREIVCLASFGLPITTDNKDSLGRFLHIYLIENQSCIPVVRLSSRFGWQEGCGSFLWGRNLINEHGVWVTSSVPKSDGLIATGGNSIVFMGHDEGDEQVADGFRCEGSLENWVAVANRAMEFPTPLVILLAALAPPLLEVIGASNFVVETAGTTSTGKTTVQRLAASVWGCPDERSEASCLYTWDTTRVWVERTAGLLNGLPLILDDTKRVFSSLPKEQARAMLNSVIYAYASGKGRGRGSVQGTQRTGSFRSVLISSGEQPCAESSAEHGGARARVLSLWGSPFGAGDQGALVKEITLAVLENYGFAGPMLVLYLLKNYDNWPIWKEDFRQAVQHYGSLAGSDNVAGRLSEIFAVLEVTAQRLLEAVPGLVLQRPVRATLEEIWPTTVAGAAQDADRALAALRDIWEWTAANPAKFFGRHRKDQAKEPIEPFGGWLGRWDASASFDNVAYLGKPLNARLEALGYDAAATIRTWADRGWLLLDSKGRFQKSVRIDAVSAKCYCIPHKVFEVELGLDLTPTPTSPTVPVSARHNPFQLS